MPNNETYQQLLASQFEASLCTLGHCLARCPGDLWSARVVLYPFYQVAFHALIFADLYLSADEESFRQQPFHLANRELFRDYEQLEDREPVLFYDRSQLLTYLAFCRSKAVATMAAETFATLSAPARFAGKNFSRGELHLVNIRHLQHHAAQLIMRLRLDANIDIPWIATGWRDLP